MQIIVKILCKKIKTIDMVYCVSYICRYKFFRKNMKISDVINIRTEKKEAHIEIFGIIGIPEYWQSDNSEDIVSTKEKMKSELKALEEIPKNIKKLVLHIDSPGGSVDHALSIFNSLNSHPAEKHTIYEGNSASAATIIGSVSPIENISIPSYMTLLVHSVRSYAMDSTTAEQDLKNAEIKRKLDSSIAKIYSNLNGKSEAENLEIMNIDSGEGMLMTAEEAKELGFVGNVVELKNQVQNIDKQVYYNCKYTENQINKLISNQNKNKMFENPFKKKVAQKAVNVGNKTILFRDLAAGEGVEILNSTDLFSGSFEVDDKIVNVVENKITEIKDVDKKGAEIKALKSQIEALKAENNEIKEAFTEILADAKSEIDSLRAEFDAAKIAKSNPELPVKDFHGEAKMDDLQMTTREKITMLQNQIAEEKKLAKEGRAK